MFSNWSLVMSVWFLLLVFITVGCFGARLSISHKFGVRLCVSWVLEGRNEYGWTFVIKCVLLKIHSCVPGPDVLKPYGLPAAGLWDVPQPCEIHASCCSSAVSVPGREVLTLPGVHYPTLSHLRRQHRYWGGRHTPVIGKLCLSFKAMGLL